MANVKISIHYRNLEIRKQGIKYWDIAEEDKKDLVNFLDDLWLGKVNKGVKISESRQVKYLDIIKIPLEFFKKPSSKLNLKDVEAFERELSSNKLLSYKKQPFAPATKLDIRRILKIYLKWKLGNNEKFMQLTDWFDTREVKRTPDFLSETEVEKLYKNCKDSGGRFVIAVLFDGGLRAEEFHNVRYEDVQIPNVNEHYPKITIKAEYSKTEGRTISLFWKHGLEAVKDYIRERERDGIKSSDPVFNNSYDNTRQFLIRLGNKVLGKSIHYHLFRHSSATYYANKLNRQQLCYRYGWRFSSDMPDVYISRSGMENKELDDKFASTELEEIKRENERLKADLGITKTGFEKELNDLKKEQDDKIQGLSLEFRKMFSAAQKSNAISDSLLNAAEKDKKIEAGMKRYLKK